MAFPDNDRNIVFIWISNIRSISNTLYLMEYNMKSIFCEKLLIWHQKTWPDSFNPFSKFSLVVFQFIQYLYWVIILAASIKSVQPCIIEYVPYDMDPIIWCIFMYRIKYKLRWYFSSTQAIWFCFFPTHLLLHLMQCLLDFLNEIWQHVF